MRSLGVGALVMLAVAATTATAAMAFQADFGGVSINLPTPAGFCELSASKSPSDRRMLTTLTDILAKSGNKLLGMSADCRQLADWQAGKRQLLDDYAQYQTSLASIGKPSNETTQQTCATLRQQGNQITSNQFPDIKARVEAALSKIKMNETSFIGVLAEDPDACYAGIVTQIHTEANTDKTQVTLFAVTIVKNRTVFVYSMSVYGPDSVNKTLTKLKANVAALFAANR